MSKQENGVQTNASKLGNMEFDGFERRYEDMVYQGSCTLQRKWFSWKKQSDYYPQFRSRPFQLKKKEEEDDEQ